MLQFLTRSGEYIKTIESHGFEQFKYNDVNTVTINENPEPFLNSLCFVYIGDILVGSGLVTGYSHRKNENMAMLTIFPRSIDLGCAFVRAGAYNADIADVIEDLLAQYTAATSEPILFLRSKVATGIQFRFTFEAGKTLREAWDFVVGKFLGEESAVIIESDGGVVIRGAGTTYNLTF